MNECLTTPQHKKPIGYWVSKKGIVKDHSDMRGNLLPLHELFFFDEQQDIIYMHYPIDGIVHTTAFVTPVVEHWLKREIAQWVYHEGSIR